MSCCRRLDAVICSASTKTLERYGKEPCSNSQKFLFGDKFCSQLKSKVESDTTLSQVALLLKRFHPYGEQSCDLHQTTLGHSKQQFFQKGPAGKVGFRQGQSPASRFQHQKAPSLQYNSQNPPLPVIWGSPRGKPRQASSTSQHLYGSLLRHDPSYTECRQTCRRENISVHTKLAQTNPRSVGPGYCSGISSTLAQWPDQRLYTKKAGDNQQLVLAVEVQKLVEKGPAQQVQLSQIHLVSPVFVIPKAWEVRG